MSREQTIPEIIERWRGNYENLKVRVNFGRGRIYVPPKPPGLRRGVIVVPNLSLTRVWRTMERRFDCWKWTDEDFDQIIASYRHAEQGAYLAWFRDRAAADYEMRNVSTVEAERRGIKGPTVLERFLHGCDYYFETGEHLDSEDTCTICSDSFCADSPNFVPYVYNHGGTDVFIGWLRRKDKKSDIRIRQVIV